MMLSTGLCIISFAGTAWLALSSKHFQDDAGERIEAISRFRSIAWRSHMQGFSA